TVAIYRMAAGHYPKAVRLQLRGQTALSAVPGVGIDWDRLLAVIGQSRWALRSIDATGAPVSIKRTSKSIGTATRKPVTSPGVRHVDVAAPRQMVSGNTYSE